MCDERGHLPTPIKSEIGKRLLALIVVGTYNGFVTAGAKTRKRGSREESAYLELWRTTDILSRRVSQTLEKEELSGTQYNVLRILRGAPAGLSCREIGNRMITRDPDITRLLDRLEKRD